MTYLFSGLGADKSVFRNLDIQEEHCFIEWSSPLPNESLTQYAKRIIETQIVSQKNIRLIGVSFGGMVAVEVAKLLPVSQVILISSAKTYHEIPILYRIIGKIQLDKLVPATLLTWANALTNYFFGVETQTEKALLKNILLHTDKAFLKWAIRQIVMWQNTDIPQNLVHIHGSADKILWYRCVKNAIKIEDGGHLMIFNRATEINLLIAVHN